MSRVSLQDLKAKEEALPGGGEALEELPQFGGFAPPPQPGSYGFKLPGNLAGCFEVIQTRLTPPERISLILDRDAPLVITAAPDRENIGQPFQTRLSNAERSRGGDGIMASDLDYLLQAFGIKTKPKSNAAYMEAVVKFGGQEFHANVSYNYSCRDDKPIRAMDAAGNLVEVPGQLGCGWRYYTGNGNENPAKKIGYIRRLDTGFPTEVQCRCGAILRAFANLDNIRK